MNGRLRAPRFTPHPAVRGFTLVEVLLALALTAVVLVETAAIFRMAARSHRRLTDTTLAAAALDDALELIARDVRRLMAPTDPSAPPLEAASNGTDTRVLRLRVAAPAVVDYFLYDEGPQRLLVRRHEPIRDGIGDGDGEPVAWEVVARDVAAFKVRFLDGAAWTDAAAGGVAPRLAEVTMALRARDGGEIADSRIVTIPVGEPPMGVSP